MSDNKVITHSSFLEGDLSDREREILRTIIHLYILNASPIGSRTLSKYIQNQLRLSPATIRNIMSDLEEMQYISQPHTSAGRVPTDKGYRFYVDSLIGIEQLNKKELTDIQTSLSIKSSESVLKEASRILGFLSSYLGIVSLPHFINLIVYRIELISLSSKRLLVVLALDSNFVKTVTLETEFEIDPKNLNEITSYINEKVSGKPLSFIRDNFTEMIKDFSLKDTALLRFFVDSVDEIFQDTNVNEKLHIAGTQNLLEYPEFEDLDSVRGIIEFLENEDIIVHLLDKYDSSDKKIKIFIGKELENELFDDYSLIVSNYSFGTASGSIGLIGPKRMQYSKMITLVKHVADYLSNKR